MPRECVYRTIADGSGRDHRYRFEQWGARKGTRRAAQLANILGGPAGRLMRGIAGKGLDFDLGEVDFGAVVESLPAKILEVGADTLAIELLDGALREQPDNPDAWDPVGQELYFDTIYAANYRELLGAIWAALDVNYGPFGTAAPQLGAALLARFATSAASRTTAPNQPPSAEPPSAATPPESTPGPGPRRMTGQAGYGGR